MPPDVSFYVYIFLGVIAGLAAVSILGYCVHQRRARRFAQRDNTNNNMQRHSLIDRCRPITTPTLIRLPI